MHPSRIALAAVIVGALQAPVLPAAQLQLATGFDFSSGDYGDDTATRGIVVPLSARLAVGSLSLRASLPYLMVKGPADIAPVIDDSGGGSRGGSGDGSGSNSSGSNSSGSSSGGSGSSGSGDDDITDFPVDRDERGFGDATLAATWSFADIGGSRLYLDVTARARLPTGSVARGLGRGTHDYAALGELGWSGRTGGVFVIGGRHMLGQGESTTPRQDGWQANAGWWRNVGRRSHFGMQANWRSATTATGTDPRSVDLFISRGLSRGFRLDISSSFGLSRASPDYAAGLGVSWRIGQR